MKTGHKSKLGQVGVGSNIPQNQSEECDRGIATFNMNVTGAYEPISSEHTTFSQHCWKVSLSLFWTNIAATLQQSFQISRRLLDY